ncbi:MAG: carotenoid biosynthesis protein [Sandaracinobacteroides sp.]
MERAAWAFLMFHVFVTVFGIVGIAIMVPNPELWAGSPMAATLFPIAVQQGGNAQIFSGAIAVLLFAATHIGWKPTLIFLAVSILIPFTLEMTGTTWGWPFGNYEYTDMLGFKILGKVPPAIPTSWFYMSFASFAIATTIIRKWRGSAALWQSILLGATLLTAWDLALDPAMSNEAVPFRYWVWEDVGPYMGIPLINFAGWLATGIVIMVTASLLSDRFRPLSIEPGSFLLLVYLTNLAFAVGICIGNQLWLPALLGSGLAGLVLVGWYKPGLHAPAIQERA